MSKVIVITGAGVGLGRALARRFAADGERVVLLGRTLEKVRGVAEEIGERALAVHCDVGSPESVKKAFAEIAQHHAHIDVLINNAAVYEPFLIAEATDEQIMQPLLTNLAGAVLCARSAIPMLNRGGHIINVSSESVALPHLPHMVMYQCSKAGLERFTEGLQRELEPAGIRVTVVRAGAMYEQGKTFNADPNALVRFHKAAADAGIHLRERPITHVSSATQVFRTLIDLPADLQALTITLAARTPHS
ncbi:MAG TPA: SDR family oxidoreductase [Polyangiales bacterium]|jgi:NAD(P)-dependent dehydrogenase (short-subunit alcohol dehydrogenase family)|nr:SDR family oxidoreductase [Polyangiales bacterium]